MAERTMSVFINPLDLFPVGDNNVSADELLMAVSPPGVPRALEDLRQRNEEICAIQPLLFAPPAEARILNQLVWPLRQAKAAYVTGNYLATIALAGLVAEMAALLVFEGHQLERGEHGPITEGQQKDVSGNTFEDLGQERRVRILRALGVITDDLFQVFNRVRGARRRHLHLSAEIAPTELEADARNMYKDAVAIVAGVLGQTIIEGRIRMNSWVWRYLKAKGFVADPEGGPTAS